ncbi:potassium transporter, putative [Talaromyces stipitatus ATCC 10500]|uniref:Potassium transport protein n=1 Tax=Talaromyces stipitatus (strain ATCC 10500 / CBS 375.48 / QM 6759 / NRRL 1006) TaxID=441959 RepID=B8M0P0_TALSN|nr:potassium transporter, putative [Talaromyces stipitatus ATCC 10500]EED21423.1 potassium transporter, putative [Talaromyces stipitatus ATCC 10500]
MTVPKRKAIRRMANLLPPLNFLTLHHAYFIVMGLIWSVIFWAAASPVQTVRYIDALFLCVSAMTGAGLNTINLSTVNSFQQAILFGLIVLGHPILISSTVLFVRKRAFESRFRSIVQAGERRRLAALQGVNLPKIEKRVLTGEGNNACPINGDSAGNRETTDGPIQLSSETGQTNTQTHSQSDMNDADAIRWADDDQLTIQSRSRNKIRHRVFPMAGVGARPDARDPKDAAPSFVADDERRSSLLEIITRNPQKYFASKGLISRNSQFHGLTASERDKLGGVEYRAICFLSIIVPLYFVLFNVLGFIGLGTWFAVNRPSVARENGLSPFWTGSFLAISAFGNNGMSLLDANMTALQTCSYVLLTMGLLILAGNTLYPCFLRFSIWTMKHVLPRTKWCEEWNAVLDFILDHPRRVYTHLFPKRHTWYLLATIILFNGIDWAGFEVLSINNTAVEILGGYRVLDGLFQAFAVRSGGFYVVTIADLHQGLLVLYVLMMYVSAFPVLVTIRNTNVYEERSLGIYADDYLAEDQRYHARLGSFVGHTKAIISHGSNGKQSQKADSNPSTGQAGENNTSRSYFVRQQIRSQLSHDIWWICLAILFITIAEGPHFTKDPISYSTFNIIFEVVSGYGCVGISVGLPDQNYSFCGGWYTISKLILIAVMLRGRHRGLPVAIDKAVMLPDESLAWAEEEDAAMRLERARSRSVAQGPIYDEKTDDIV